MLRKLLLSAALLISITASAQVSSQYPWEFGIQLGTSSMGGELIQNDVIFLNQPSFSAGLTLRRRLGGLFALRAHLLYGGLKGDDTKSDEAPQRARGFKAETSIIEPGLVLEFEPLAQRRFVDGQFKKILSPYIYGGIGYGIWQDQNTDFNGRNDQAVQNDIANNETSGLVLPYGFGLKFYLSEKSSLGLDFGARLMSSDYLEGVSQSGNPDKNDTYAFLGLRFSTGFGIKDSDKDGIPDDMDACPEQAGPESTNGCPDSDGDGLPDRDDTCPDEAGVIALGGCPDADGDGVADKDDDCPTVAGVASLMGCPDSDGDGIADKDDECPTVAGIASFNGCPDTDGDGIADKDDDCPTVAGTSRFNGCPDSDGDGIPDADDECPDQAGTSARNGCPEPQEVYETIADRIIRYQPLVEDLEHIALDETTGTVVIENIYFRSDRYNRDQLDREILDDIVTFLTRSGTDQFTVRFEGHADRRNTEEYNQTLSENRANAAMEYMLSKGIDASRMSMIGFGKNQPVAPIDDLQANRVVVSVAVEPARRVE